MNGQYWIYIMKTESSQWWPFGFGLSNSIKLNSVKSWIHFFSCAFIYLAITNSIVRWGAQNVSIHLHWNETLFIFFWLSILFSPHNSVDPIKLRFHFVCNSNMPIQRFTLVCWFGFSLMEKKNEIYEQQKANNFAVVCFFAVPCIREVIRIKVMKESAWRWAKWLPLLEFFTRWKCREH